MEKINIYIDYKETRYIIQVWESGKKYVVSNNADSDVFIADKSFDGFSLEVAEKDKQPVITLCSKEKKTELQLNHPFLLNNNPENKQVKISCYKNYEDYLEIYVETLKELNFGRSPGNHIVLKNCNVDNLFKLVNQNDQWAIISKDEHHEMYLNGSCINTFQSIEEGDIISYREYIIVFHGTYCSLYHQYAVSQRQDVILYKPDSEHTEGYPYYKRSPRIFYHEPEEKIIIPQPNSSPEQDKASLLMAIGPNVLMIGVTVGTGFLMGRGLMMLIMAVTSAATLVTTISKFFSDKKKAKKNETDRIDFYRKLLDGVRKKIRSQLLMQRECLEQSLPSLEDEEKIVESFDRRLWEKSPSHNDFLHVRIGKGSKLLSFNVSYETSDSQQNEKDALHTEAKTLASKYNMITDIPLKMDFTSGITGIVGKPQQVFPHLMAILGHICVSHSYKDVQLVIVYSEENDKDFSWLKWVPHTWIGKRQFKALIKNSRTRDNILGSIYQMIKGRKNDLKDKDKNAGLPSRIIFVIADLPLIFDHAIMEYLLYNQAEIGVYSIYIGERMEEIPESASNVLLINEFGKGTIVKDNNVDSRKEYTPDMASTEQLNKISRRLAPVQHVSNVTNNIPNSVTLFEMYKIEKPVQYNLLQRWKENKPYKTLAVPLGLRGTDDIVNLNLHEKAHGPHGLVAGTTGSGKSETIQSYIISLAVNFHPYDIAFLLIDYKGGGMAELFKDLPHLLGTITNLDGAQTMRALVAIKSENLRRQNVFKENGVNHIDQYQKLFNEGVVKEPMPHLFIISDEFAELKQEKPEFIKELVSVARIGRSLGVHLILATQKPDGVVDEQISSNAKFRICLKVQNPSDSNSMIKTPDAAYITQAGRGYLMVGNNEIYELFQSAWSGAKYKLDGGEETGETADDNIYLFNDLGQTQLMTQDFSNKVKAEEKQSEVVTQLDATVIHIDETFSKLGLARVPSPWLPPLENRIYLPDIINNQNMDINWDEAVKEFNVVLGRVDQPQLQKQSDFEINLSKSGHIIVFGSASMGKSNFLRTLAVSAAINYSPDELNFYIIDFGSNNLLPLRDLPHTADVMTIDTTEKTEKFQRIILTEMKRRKDLLGKLGVSNVDMYRKVTKEKLPNIVILLDNYDIVREQSESLDKTVTDISRDGMACGIFLAISASRSAAFRSNIIANVKNQLALFLIDKSDITSIVGRTELDQEESPGRGLVKFDMVYSMQIALPVKAETEEEMREAFNECVDKIKNSWTGKKVKPIPMLPEKLTLREFKENETVDYSVNSKRMLVPVGLDNENVEALNIDFSQTTNMLIIGGAGTGKANAMKLVIEMLLKKPSKPDIYIIDNAMIKLNAYKKNGNITGYITADKEKISELMSALGTEAANRRNKYVEHMQNDGELTPAEFYSQFKDVFIIISGGGFIEMAGTNQAKYATFLEEIRQTGIHVIFCTNAAELSKGYDALTKAFKSIDEGLLLVTADRQQVWNLPYQASKEKPLMPGEAFYIKGSGYLRVKVPLVS